MKYLYLFVAAFLIQACSETKDGQKPPQLKEKPGVVTEVETVYEEGEFKNPKYKELLKELDVCSEEKVCLQCATCTPEFFRFFEIAKNRDVKDIFAIQIKALTLLKDEDPLPTREVRVFVRENGSLVLSNWFRGYVVNEITNESGVSDLVLRIRKIVDDEEHFFHCLFQWSTSDKKYRFKSVERIEGRNWGGPVKESEKEATSQQVYSELVQAGYIR
ncbi:MAG: hypothetical protein ACFHU9_02270 [Fluviicola sp.]